MTEMRKLMEATAVLFEQEHSKEGKPEDQIGQADLSDPDLVFDKLQNAMAWAHDFEALDSVEKTPDGFRAIIKMPVYADDRLSDFTRDDAEKVIRKFNSLTRSRHKVTAYRKPRRGGGRVDDYLKSYFEFRRL